MILSDGDIKDLIDAGLLEIKPITDYDLQLQPASFDLHLNNEFRKIKPGVTLDMNEGISEEDTFTFTVGDSYVLDPGEFILADTVEKVKIPNGYVGRVEGRSSIGRMAVDVHATAGYIDPGFGNPTSITLEISNKMAEKGSNNPVVLRPGRRFCQLVVEKTKSPSIQDYKEKGGKYNDQEGPTASKINTDEEL